VDGAAGVTADIEAPGVNSSGVTGTAGRAWSGLTGCAGVAGWA